MAPSASSRTAGPDPRLGAQLWLERDDTPERVDHLVAQAAACGLGRLRIFVMWPWIEPAPGQWEFSLYDAAFDAAARHGIGIKATLTTGSGPWHVGTPGVQHSQALTLDGDQRPAMKRYLEQIVQRYSGHPALAQWILWNEPRYQTFGPGRDDPRRSGEQLTQWRRLLASRYPDVQALNERWYTGYTDFDQIPFPEQIPHRAHHDNPWISFRPWLDEADFRAEWLRFELSWIADIVREIDPDTPLCINPDQLLSNHAAGGYDFAALSEVVDVMGASFHAPWHLTFAPQTAHLGLITAGIGLLRAGEGEKPVEVTEFQLGNTCYSGAAPMGVTPASIAAGFLAPLAAGAQSVCGWSLNARQRDFEAGEWGLLDDTDRVGDRGRAVARVRDLLVKLSDATGGWTPRRPAALVLTGTGSQAVQLVHASTGPDGPLRNADDAARGAGLLALELLRLGVPAAVTSIDAGVPRADLLVASHLGAWTDEQAKDLLSQVRDGATLVLDGISGQKDLDAALHRPWPGGLAEALGFSVTGLDSRPDGHPVTLAGAPAGVLPLARTVPEFTDPAWSADEHVRLPLSGHAPCLWRRAHGNGSVVFVGGALGPAVLRDPTSTVLARYVLASAVSGWERPVRPLSPDTMTFLLDGEERDAIAVFGTEPPERVGQPLRLALPPGDYTDLWMMEDHFVGGDGELTLPAPDGVVVLVARYR